MAIKWRSKILLAKLEASYAVDAAPTAADNAILATQVELRPMEGQDVSRDLETPWLGGQPTIPTELHMMLSYRVELVGSGTAGTAPAWAPCLRACGCAQVVSAGASVAYNPVSDGHESVTHHLWIGGTLYALVGGRGTCVFRVNAQGIVYMEFQFTGLFTKPAEAARGTPDLTDFQKPQVATKANTPGFTVDGVSLVMRSFSLDLRNTVEPIFLIGAESIEITDRQELVETRVHAVPLTTLDPFQLALDQEAVAVELVHGTAAGRIATLEVPAAQMQRTQGLENAQGIKEWPLRLAPLPVAGNDQWTLNLT
ncbi:hypothetical protein [Frigidibacter oleivorans]|uniref:hypothetical protein n=1 Tax=Frigidibacter oleivorans TaxID=2487129 RepID=UPI000F8E94E7|nr:hypothetical protein [Frigidibacter oleivorans]